MADKLKGRVADYKMSYVDSTSQWMNLSAHLGEGKQETISLEHITYEHPSGKTFFIFDPVKAGIMAKTFGGVISGRINHVEGNDGVTNAGDGKEYEYFTIIDNKLRLYDNITDREADTETAMAPILRKSDLTMYSKDMESIGKVYRRMMDWNEEHPLLNIDDSDFEEPNAVSYTHDNLYHGQEDALRQIEEQGQGFHVLAGEVGVGKTHIASEYIKDLKKANPHAQIRIFEPIEGVKQKFADLLDLTKGDDGDFVSKDGNILMTSTPAKINHREKYDLVVFDEFHKLDDNVKLKQYPSRAAKEKKLPKNVLALTGTVSNEYPEQIWRVGHNYARLFGQRDGSDIYSAMSSANDMMSIQKLPEAFVNVVLDKNTVSLLRNDIEELRVEERMPVTKKAIGFDLTKEDRAFYNMMTRRARALNMDTKNQLQVLDRAFNTNQKEFVVQPVKTLGGKSYYQMVDNIDDVEGHELLYLGKHDQPFVDRKIEAIADLAGQRSDKILVYMTDDDYANRVIKDLEKSGVSAEFVDTKDPEAVSMINDSDKQVVVFDVRPIQEGIDLHANTVVWYNTPDAAGFDEQANGRITRLSSEKTEKNIYYLYHKTTIQEEITQNLIRTNEINNMALNRKDETFESDMML